jgi:mannonate dehydratase
MIEIAELLPPQPGPLWTLVKQTGVTHAIGILPYGEIGPEVTGPQSWTQIHGSAVTATRTAGGERLWDYGPLLHLKTRYEDGGFKLAAIESSPPMDKIRLGLPGRDNDNPGYSSLGRLFAIGYIKGLREAVYAEV